jgi:hypothetical protein
MVLYKLPKPKSRMGLGYDNSVARDGNVSIALNAHRRSPKYLLHRCRRMVSSEVIRGSRG